VWPRASARPAEGVGRTSSRPAEPEAGGPEHASTRGYARFAVKATASNGPSDHAGEIAPNGARATDSCSGAARPRHARPRAKPPRGPPATVTPPSIPRAGCSGVSLIAHSDTSQLESRAVSPGEGSSARETGATSPAAWRPRGHPREPQHSAPRRLRVQRAQAASWTELSSFQNTIGLAGASAPRGRKPVALHTARRVEGRGARAP
jgi:hypothetical protein